MAGVYETLTLQQKLRLTLQRDVQAICQEACQILELDIQDHAVDLIAELAWNNLQVYATDLEQFAKHAKRSTINTEDIKLLVRRNSTLKSYVTGCAENISATSGSKDKKKKGNAANAGNSSAAGNSKTKFTEDATKTSNKPTTSNKDDMDEPTIDLT
ncbi:centromere protein S-like [Arctopsyche grandis]|uniref:centromere protein S-like n=1 Tax=Arctopsyche grandis TaxID=121162 RepID=UPI00406D7558